MTVVKPLSSHQINQRIPAKQMKMVGATAWKEAQSQITQMLEVSAEHCKQCLETQEEDHPRVLSETDAPENY